MHLLPSPLSVVAAFAVVVDTIVVVVAVAVSAVVDAVSAACLSWAGVAVVVVAGDA